jgi:SAM-dependent methyltransferase
VKTLPSNRYLTIDENGYFVLDGLRVSDESLGQDWLSRLRIDERGRPFLSGESDLVLIEAFDQPLIALEASVSNTGTWHAKFPYGFERELLPDSLRVDEWDRFYARTVDGVPCVLNRHAQDSLFQQAEEYDDDSITFGTHSFPILPLFSDLAEAEQSEWWSELYRNGETRWDNGAPHPLLDRLIPPLKIARSRVLVLGCGAGHDAAWWEKRGHIVTGVDFSSEAIARARALYGERDTLKWKQADAFQLPQQWTSSFDVIFEHTMFCAITPSKRETLVRTWWRLLSPRGRLIGLVPIMDKTFGPPFGTSEWEMRKRLLDTTYRKLTATKRALFHPLLWEREKNSSEKRKGQELFFAVERADSSTD